MRSPGISQIPTTPAARPITIRSEWLRAYVRERGGSLFVITGLFVVG